ncbi:MAG: sulfatase [Candidatus Sumerlaeota bacterium]
MTDRPASMNVLWIFGDQHRAQALGYMGNPQVSTPHLDALAGRGVTFTNAVAGCPWCTPFRGSLITSRYVHEAVQQTPQRLDPALPTVADAFNEAGYMTAWFGKWHLAGSNNRVYVEPELRGRFQVWEGYENNNAQYDSWVHSNTDGVADETFLETYETDALTTRMIDFLEERKDSDQPFFGVLSVQPPHNPYLAPEEYLERHKSEDVVLRPNVPPIDSIQERARKDLAGYYAMIENFDDNIGRLIEALERTGLAENTMIVFFADHGDTHGSHGYFRKSNPYEEALRIPCIWALPGGKSGESDAPMNHVDCAPTSLGACGIDVPDWMAGTDFSPHLLDGKTPDREAEPQSAYLQQCVRKGFECVDRVWRGVRTRDGWKYVCLEGQPLLMTNLNEDPYETVNRAFHPEFKDKRAELQNELAAWIEKTGDEFELPEL